MPSEFPVTVIQFIFKLRITLQLLINDTKTPFYLKTFYNELIQCQKASPSQFQKNTFLNYHILILLCLCFYIKHFNLWGNKQISQLLSTKNSCDCQNLNMSVFIQMHAHIQFYVQKSTSTQNISVVYVFMLHYSVRL